MASERRSIEGRIQGVQGDQHLVGYLVPNDVMLVIHYILPALTALLFVTDFHIPKFDVAKFFRKHISKKA